MWPLRLACLALVAGTMAVVAARHAGGSPPATRPNILLVSIDSLRADHLGSYGYARDTTPSIDRLARRGVLFESAISSASWTVPAHMTMLTGLPPEVHGVSSYKKALSPDAVTLAEVLRDAGYETAAFVSGPTVMAQYGFAQGFAQFDESMVDPNFARSHIGVTSPGLVALVDRFFAGWNDAGRRAPFFVFLHMWDVHYDYAPPAPYDRMFDPGYTGNVTATNYERNPRIKPDMDPRDLAHVIALYDGEIRFTDEHLGQVLDRLAALHVLDDTIVVVTADHGDEFFEHGMKGHAKTLYDEVLHVPMVISYPRRIRFGQRVHAQVRLMDLAPTILGLAGIAPPPGFGLATLEAPYRFADLSRYVAGVAPRRDVPELPAFSDIQSIFGHERALRTPEAKLIQYERRRSGRFDTEVFDLVKDPGEHRNLVKIGAAHLLKAKLDPEMATWEAALGAETQLAVTRQPSARHTARLKSLGYIE